MSTDQTATTEPGTRARKTAATRERIVAAARDVFTGRGYRTASLRDVASAAGLSHPGLLKHFATKDRLLAAVIAEFDAATADALRAEGPPTPVRGLAFARIAARNETLPGYLPLYAALVGEASTPGHPAHASMRERYAHLRRTAATEMGTAIGTGAVHSARDLDGEAARIAAAWDGLQLLELYLPERVQLVPLLTEAQELLSVAPAWRASADEAAFGAADAAARAASDAVSDTASGTVSDTVSDAGAASAPASGTVAGWPVPDADADEGGTDGYRVGRERRARIIRDATSLFARDGYTDTSLREIATRVGLSKSALLHHYPSKEALLRAVLAERDRAVSTTLPTNGIRGADLLRELPRRAAIDTDSAPGLVRLYAVLSCEALTLDHPAHDYFTLRYAAVIDYFAGLLRVAQRDGDLPAHRDPEREAIRLVALWDGLQYQWLYDPDSVDVSAQLAAHLDDILPPR